MKYSIIAKAIKQGLKDNNEQNGEANVFATGRSIAEHLAKVFSKDKTFNKMKFYEEANVLYDIERK